MTKAIFLDRDGVLNKELGRYTKSRSELVILDHAKEACAKLKREGYKLIVITNQGGIAKGEYTREDLAQIHEVIEREIPQIDAFFFCPHHDNIGKCLCRKPDSLMLEKAIYLFNIKVEESFMIGDSLRDIEAAEKAGLKGVKIDSNAYWDNSFFK
jgi:D-glycero-D-manno-heptose 1,7-bisphosphate phosphatase